MAVAAAALSGWSRDMLLQLVTILFLSSSVIAQSLPHFTTHPSSTVVREGMDATLNCVTNYTGSNLSYQWTVNDTIIPQSNNVSYTLLANHSLQINSFSLSLNGNYSCLLTNGNWTVKSNYASVQQALVSSAYNEQSRNLNIQRNDYAVIDCIPSYSIVPVESLVLYWYFQYNGQPRTLYISDDHSANYATVGANGSLYLRKVTESIDYQCRIENSILQTYRSYTTRVNVSGTKALPSPTVLAEPYDIVANEGEMAAMSCIASGGSSTVSWIHPSGSYNEETIIRTDISPNDEGSYSCNITGTPDTYTGMLSIRNPPRITANPFLITNIDWGSSIELSCSATGNELQWVWFFNGVHMSSSATVSIATANLSHSGTYQCFATNPAGTDSSSTLLTVRTIPPTFTANGSLTNHLAFSGSSLALTCNATGAPMPEYMWKKEETQLSSGNSDFDFTVPGTLVVNRLTSALQGNYTCVARASIDNSQVIGEINSTAEVFVADPTAITSTHHANLSIIMGQSVTLNCSAVHDNEKTTIRLQWLHNGNMISNSSHTTLVTPTGQSTHLNLLITQVTSNDQGNYKCVVHTDHISRYNLTAPVVESRLTSVIIIDAPIKPVITSVLTLSSTSLEVNWRYDGSRGDLSSFLIQFTEADNINWNDRQQLTVSGTGSTRKNITNLSPYTFYLTQVIAVLVNNGMGVTSDPYGPSRTMEDIPSSAPQNVNAISRSTTGISLYWEAPALSDRNGLIIDYTISYWTNSIPVKNITVGSNTTSYTLIDLIDSNTYWISVAAHTSAGRGPFSRPVNSSTDPTIGGVDENTSSPVHQKIWFIFTVCIAGLALIIFIFAIIAAIRWNKRRNKGHRYPVRSSFRVEEADFSPDVVADYEKRKKVEPLSSLYTDEGESESSQTTIPPSLTYATYASSNDGGGSLRVGMPPFPPSYINPPSFEDTLKLRLNRRRSASMSLLEKAEHLHLSDSGWSVGHDPKNAFISDGYDNTVDDDSIDKAHLRMQYPLDDMMSGGSSDSRLQSNTLATRSGSLATFV